MASCQRRDDRLYYPLFQIPELLGVCILLLVRMVCQLLFWPALVVHLLTTARAVRGPMVMLAGVSAPAQTNKVPCLCRDSGGCCARSPRCWRALGSSAQSPRRTNNRRTAHRPIAMPGIRIWKAAQRVQTASSDAPQKCRRRRYQRQYIHMLLVYTVSRTGDMVNRDYFRYSACHCTCGPLLTHQLRENSRVVLLRLSVRDSFGLCPVKVLSVYALQRQICMKC